MVESSAMSTFSASDARPTRTISMPSSGRVVHRLVAEQIGLPHHESTTGGSVPHRELLEATSRLRSPRSGGDPALRGSPANHVELVEVAREVENLVVPSNREDHRILARVRGTRWLNASQDNSRSMKRSSGSTEPSRRSVGGLRQERVSVVITRACQKCPMRCIARSSGGWNSGLPGL